MSAPGARPRLGLPIAVQIIGLLMAVLLVGQVATLVVVSVLPPPRPPVYRIEEIAAALKGLRAAPRYAPPLLRTMDAAPPKDSPQNEAWSGGLRTELARLLAVSPGQVRMRIEPPPRWSFPFGGRRRDHRYPGLGRPPDVRPPPDALSPPDSLSTIGPPVGGAFGSATQNAVPDGAAPAPAKDASPEGDRPRPWFARPYRGYSDRAGLVVGHVEAAYQPSPGPWVVVRTPAEPFPNAWQRRIVLWFLACLLVLTPVGYLFAQRLTAPIRRFARAADRLGRDPRAPPLTLSGPAEIGLAAAAFNEMQARLARYIEDRTAMIAAIAHDLRTPLARVQFKLQRAPDALAADIRSDLGQMEAMIAAVLGFVRDLTPAFERSRLDLLSLLEVVADDAGDTGADVRVEAGPVVVVEGDASALQRIFVNLVDNAIKYGGQARIALAQEGGDAVVKITDDGPGIPEAEIERVFEPFHRLESSRSRETGGIGLGLSVARTIARAHGGDVFLESKSVGLTAVVRIPAATP